jgi:hypothetical protein
MPRCVTLSGTGIERTERWLEVGRTPRTLLVDIREPSAALLAERNSRRELQLTFAQYTQPGDQCRDVARR